MHVAIRFAYDGTLFDAYARNPEMDTVESRLLKAFASQGYVAHSYRSGSRTDRHVSALENVCTAAFDRPHIRGLVPALQAHLPVGIWVSAATEVDAAWNPRHHALRTYRYLLPRHREDPDRMAAATRPFLGRHDMRAFARLDGDRDPEREVRAFTVEADPDWWTFRVESPGYLWNQVRRMVSAVQAVGAGDAQVADIEAALRTGVPHRDFGLAPAEGLLLESVRYKDLEWDPAAGRLPPQRVLRGVQGAQVRSRLMQHLRGLAGPVP